MGILKRAIEAAKAASKRLICKGFGHKLRYYSYAGPDHGYMGYECKRCGRYWSTYV